MKPACSSRLTFHGCHPSLSLAVEHVNCELVAVHHSPSGKGIVLHSPHFLFHCLVSKRNNLGGKFNLAHGFRSSVHSCGTKSKVERSHGGQVGVRGDEPTPAGLHFLPLVFQRCSQAAQWRHCSPCHGRRTSPSSAAV